MQNLNSRFFLPSWSPRMLLGEVSEEEANQLLDNLMTEEEKQEEQEDDMDSLQGSEPVR